MKKSLDSDFKTLNSIHACFNFSPDKIGLKLEIFQELVEM